MSEEGAEPVLQVAQAHLEPLTFRMTKLSRLSDCIGAFERQRVQLCRGEELAQNRFEKGLLVVRLVCNEPK